MKALVTGGGGFLGGRIVEMLLARGDTVRVFGRQEYPHLADRGVVCRRGDLRDPAAVVDACAGMDTVFHVAAKAGVWGDPTEFFGINAKGTANVIRGCLENKVACLVYTSSPSVAIGRGDIAGADETLPYPARYLAAYPRSKAAAEKMVLDAHGWEMVPNDPSEYGPDHGEKDVRRLRTCALRPHLIWGPGDPHLVPRIIETARQGRLPIVGTGTNRVDITYIDNAAIAHLQAADELAGAGRCGGKAYFIGDDEPVALWEWINGLLVRLGIPPLRRRLPYAPAYAMAAAMEAVHRALPSLGEPRLTRFSVSQLAHSHWFSHARAAADFGYRAVVGPAEGLDRLIDWFQGRAAAAAPRGQP